MNFNKHLNLKDRHALFGASTYSWVNYDDQKLIETVNNQMAVQRGTRLHALAAELIDLGQKLPKTHNTLNMYVNDSIRHHMVPEQKLYYSDNFFGTADAIQFKNNLLRIFDYKSGRIPAKMTQLKIYAALFCLEYKVKPGTIDFELRIYQSDEVFVENPTAEDILPIMDKIVHFDKLINKLKKGD